MMMEGSEGNFSTLVNVLSIGKRFQVENDKARELINEMIDTIEHHWTSVCEETNLSVVERDRLWGNCLFNPFCFRGWDGQT